MLGWEDEIEASSTIVYVLILCTWYKLDIIKHGKIWIICHLYTPVGSSMVLDTGRWGGRRDGNVLFLILSPGPTSLTETGGMNVASFILSFLYLQVCSRKERGSRNSEGLLSSLWYAVTYIVSLGMPLCASFFLSVNELVGLGRWILKRTFLTPVSSTGSYCERLRYGLRGVTLSGVGTAVHHVAPAPSQSFCCVQASEMVKWLWNNCFLADSGLGGVEWRLRKVCICPKTDKWYVSKSIISRGS